jgi:hypothetical protein
MLLLNYEKIRVIKILVVQLAGEEHNESRTVDSSTGRFVCAVRGAVMAKRIERSTPPDNLGHYPIQPALGKGERLTLDTTIGNTFNMKTWNTLNHTSL